MKISAVLFVSCLMAFPACFAQQMIANGLEQGASAVPAQVSRATSDDISREVVDATIARLPTAHDFGEWGYSRALFLLGDLNVYRRTHDPRYLTYAKAWADLHVDDQGKLDHTSTSLDSIMPGSVLIELYQATGEEKYKRGAANIYAAFKDYSRTSDGAFWHAENGKRDHQLWLDGTYMATPFMVRAGAMLGQEKETNDEAAKQLLLYNKHLKDAHGPLYLHAYDESGTMAWANATTHQSSIKWGRSIGWYAMALVDVMDAIPSKPKDAEEQAQRKRLLAIIQELAHDLVQVQDPATGLWFQVIDQPTVKGNFLETSSSSMFTYFLDISVKRGYIPASYHAAVEHGRQGVLSKVTTGADGRPHISDISEGTDVADLPYYLARQRPVDDFHGLGAFLLMNEEVQFNQPAMQLKGFAH